MKMGEAEQLREAFVGLSKAFTEVFAQIRKTIFENLNKMMELKKEAQKYIERQKETRKGWTATGYHILRSQVVMRKPVRVVARSCC
jgi:hypothetical protein